MATPEYDRHYGRIIDSNGDPYRILDVDERAEDDDIRSSYKRLALLFHPDRVKRMTSGRSAGVAKDLQTRSDQAFRLIGLACALLLDEKKRRDYDRRAYRTRQGEDVGAGETGADALGGIKTGNKDPEAFFDTIFHTQGKERGTENFDNWLTLAFTGQGESDLGSVVHGNPDLAKGDSKDDKVSKQLAEMGLADHTKQLSIPGAEDAKRHFKSSRARTTHTNRKGETTVQRTGTSVAMIDGGENGNIIVESTYKVVGFVPKGQKPPDKAGVNGKLPGGISHLPKDDPRFKAMEDEHERDMKEKSDKHNRREDKRTYSDTELEEKYNAGLIGDGRSMAQTARTGRTRGDDQTMRTRGTSRPYDDAASMAPSRMTARTQGTSRPFDENASLAPSRATKATKYDDADTMRGSMAPSMAKSYAPSNAGTRIQDSRSVASRAPTSRGRDDATLASRSPSQAPTSRGRDDATLASRSPSQAPTSRGRDDATLASRSPSKAPTSRTRDDATLASRSPSQAPTSRDRDDATLASRSPSQAPTSRGRDDATLGSMASRSPSMARSSSRSRLDDDDARSTRTGRTGSSQRTSRPGGGGYDDAPPLPLDFADTIRTKGGASMAPSRATRGGGEATLSSRMTKDDRTLSSRAPTQRTAAYDDMKSMKSSATGASRGQTLRTSKSAANLNDKNRFTISDYEDLPDMPGRGDGGTMRTKQSRAAPSMAASRYDDPYDAKSMKTTRTSGTAATGRTAGTSRTERDSMPYYPGPNTR